MAESSSAQIREMVANLEPDAHGQAALLLAESTLHMLIEVGVLNNAQAFDVVRTAAEVKLQVAHATGESTKRMQQSLTLLERISETFRSDEAA